MLTLRFQIAYVAFENADAIQNVLKLKVMQPLNVTLNGPGLNSSFQGHTIEGMRMTVNRVRMPSDRQKKQACDVDNSLDRPNSSSNSDACDSQEGRRTMEGEDGCDSQEGRRTMEGEDSTAIPSHSLKAVEADVPTAARTYHLDIADTSDDIFQDTPDAPVTSRQQPGVESSRPPCDEKKSVVPFTMISGANDPYQPLSHHGDINDNNSALIITSSSGKTIALLGITIA